MPHKAWKSLSSSGPLSPFWSYERKHFKMAVDSVLGADLRLAVPHRCPTLSFSSSWKLNSVLQHWSSPSVLSGVSTSNSFFKSFVPKCWVLILDSSFNGYVAAEDLFSESCSSRYSARLITAVFLRWFIFSTRTLWNFFPISVWSFEVRPKRLSAMNSPSRMLIDSLDKASVATRAGSNVKISS